MRTILAAALIGLSTVSYGQKELTMEDAILGPYSYLKTDNLNLLQFVPESDELTYYAIEDQNRYYAKSTNGGKSFDSWIELADLNKSLASDQQLQSMPVLHFTSSSKAWAHQGKYVYSVDLGKKSASVLYELPEGASNIEVNESSMNIAFTVENNLFVGFDGEIIQVTHDEDKAIVNGQAVHRYEFGISKGIFWSNDGSKVAYYKNDQNTVTQYPLLNINTTPGSNTPTYYPMAGLESEMVSLFVFDIKSGQNVKMNTMNEMNYLTNITFTPDNKNVFVGHLNRDQNEYRLVSYSAQDGSEVAFLTDESHDKYVQSLHAPIFVNDGFLRQSEQGGLTQFYVHNMEGELIHTPALENLIVLDVIDYNSQNNVIYFYATEADKIDRNVYRIELSEGAEYEQVSSVAGMHNAVLSSDFTSLIDSYTNIEVPRKIEIVNLGSLRGKTIFTADNPYEDYVMGQTEVFTIKAADEKTDLYCRMIKPADFDPSKTYPTLVYVYNGPGVQLIHNQYMAGASLWMHTFANRGMIVFTIDGRGSENRGRDFEQVTFRQLGQEEMKDQMKGVEYLKSLSYVDKERMGLHGWSYGGFMTTSMMVNYPDVFDAAVAGGPVIDWSLYEVMYTERYMDTPDVNKEGYDLTNVANKAENLKGRLMLIHGSVDDVVVPQHSLRFLQACVSAQVPVDFFMYPMHPHNVRGKDRIHLMEKVWDYLDTYIE